MKWHKWLLVLLLLVTACQPIQQVTVVPGEQVTCSGPLQVEVLEVSEESPELTAEIVCYQSEVAGTELFRREFSGPNTSQFLEVIIGVNSASFTPIFVLDSFGDLVQIYYEDVLGDQYFYWEKE